MKNLLAPVSLALFLLAAPGVAADGDTESSGRPRSFVGAAAERVTFTGAVIAEDGAPVAGALVETSAGGATRTEADGTFELAVDVPTAALQVEVTASTDAGRGALDVGQHAMATGTAWVGSLVIAPALVPPTSWIPTFGGAPGLGSTIWTLETVELQGKVYVACGGAFETAGGIGARFIALWDGTTWLTLGPGFDDDVRAIAVFDDGAGPALYAGGSFEKSGDTTVNHLAKWDGTSWTSVGGGTSGLVLCLEAFDDGSGPALFVGGQFETAGGVTVKSTAKWDGTSWSPMGPTIAGGFPGGPVHDFEVFDDGSGPALHVGGGFIDIGGVEVKRVAKWDGSDWSPLATGLESGAGVATVRTLEVYDDGHGPQLYAGGTFTKPGNLGLALNKVAKWNGIAWQAVSGGFDANVFELLTFDDGGVGPRLYAVGQFSTASGSPASFIARRESGNWSAVPGALALDCYALAAADLGNGADLYVGGAFRQAGSVVANHIARWDSPGWSALGHGLDSTVEALASFDDGNGPTLFVGGSFRTANGEQLERIATWDPGGWSSIGDVEDPNPSIRALAVHDDGSGKALYAGGSITTIGGVAVGDVARWNGTTWAALGDGVSGPVRAFAELDDGTGNALFVGGQFSFAGGELVGAVAKWDGFDWSALDSGVIGVVYSLAAFDDGSGPALYAGGSFSSAGGVPAANIARWDGAGWSALAGGVNSSVEALAVFDDGSGPALYVGGLFTTAGGVSVNRIARWNGTSWSAVGHGLGGNVYDLTVFGRGPAARLYAGGNFDTAGPTAAGGVARWNGSAWSPLGRPVVGRVFALQWHRIGNVPSLFVGGNFGASPAGDSFLARWGPLQLPMPSFP